MCIRYGRLYKILTRIRIIAKFSYFTGILSGKFLLNYLELASNWLQNALNQCKKLPWMPWICWTKSCGNPDVNLSVSVTHFLEIPCVW